MASQEIKLELVDNSKRTHVNLHLLLCNGEMNRDLLVTERNEKGRAISEPPFTF